MRLGTPSSIILVPVLMALAPQLTAADVITVSGRGETIVDKKLRVPEANQKALEKAEGLAIEDALAQALYAVYGNRAKLGPDHDRILREVVNHKATLMLGTNITANNVDGGKAVVETTVRVDGKAFKRLLEDSLGLSLAQEVEGKFKVITLAYTIEGMDADQTKPMVLKEEVTDNRTDIESASFATKSASASASAHQASLKASASTSSKGNSAYQGSSKAAAAYSQSNGNGATAAKLAASTDVNASGQWNNHDSASLNAQSSQSNAASSSSSASGSYYKDASSQYHHLTIYADPTKKGSGTTNEVRAALAEILEKSGLGTKFVDMDLMGQTFATEDSLYLTIRNNLKKNPEVQPSDYVAVALNRLTLADPGKNTHRYTSSVTYRVIRIKDGDTLLPDKLLTGDSGDQASDDLGRASATKLAILKADSVLPEELRTALRKVARAETRENAAAATVYVIRVDNLSSPVVTLALKQALRSAGFTVTPQFRGDARSETINVGLNGKAGEDVMAVIEPHIANFNVSTMDVRNTILACK